MKKNIFCLLLGFILVTLQISVNSCFAEAVVGKLAPDFTATDSLGNRHSLSEYKGKFVVLEWMNHGCPFVRKHYEGGNMQKLQSDYTAKGVVWLSIASSGPGKEGYMTPDQANTAIAEKHSAATALLLDADGKIGRLYGARTTPHMFIVGPDSNLIYAGAIDDNSSTRSSSIAGAKNYVAKALDEALAGKAVSEPNTEPYGCSVKYQS